MSTLLFKFVFLSSASPAVVLTSTELTGAAAPTVNISSVLLADGTTIASEVSGGALVYDSYTKSWSYRLASATLATKAYTGMATTTYATASPASVHALGIVIPDELVSSRSTLTAQQVWEYATRTLSSIADSAGVSTLLSIFTGMTSLPKWLRGLFRKDAMDATAKVEVNAGGGTFSETTDSLEALSEALGNTGPSSKVYTLTVDGLPAEGVYCRLCTDLAGTANVTSGTTNSLGQVTFWHNLPTGTTVYIHAAPAGYDPLVDTEEI